jgi:starch phosphorylase
MAAMNAKTGHMTSRPVRTYTVLPHLPPRLTALQTIAYNAWWSWHSEAVSLFRRIDDELFGAVERSPIRLLGALPQNRFNELAGDESFLAHMDRVAVALEQYLAAPTWYAQQSDGAKRLRVGYFSAEFGIHESIPVYSGGLGVLAGDHLKSASDLGLPLVGVGLMYREGYFRQYLNADGWQQERYPDNDFFTLPLLAENDSHGKPLLVSVPFPGRDVKARIWRIQVGRVPLYLLDTNIPENLESDREITARLYGGDAEMRVMQEMMLGIGGLRALDMLGQRPTVCHMNEGHSAFCALERMRQTIEERDVDFATAFEVVKAGTCFTTHTPVPAGNDAFPPDLIERYLGWYVGALGIDRDTFIGLGRQRPADQSEPFGMTVLAIKSANSTNGVSELHGAVAREMWKGIFPGLPSGDVPIISITNGVHVPTWASPEIEQLFIRYVDYMADDEPGNFFAWTRAEQIPDAELWRLHERRRERLVSIARERGKRQLVARNAPPWQLDLANEALDPYALTIGFARRFATYKRGDLVFRDIDRLIALLNNKDRPVQLIFAGKAHPHDAEGKAIIQRIVQAARRPELRRRVVFLEDYDMAIARLMIQGVDVWLNNPRRPQEASGTSGMKVACNGGLNFSVLDGWWVEGFDGNNGWAIGAGEEYTDLNYEDEVESRTIYDLLEEQIAPLFYGRDSDGIPREWVRRMKHSIASNTACFNSNRMLTEYLERCYLPAERRFEKLSGAELKGGAKLAAWRRRVRASWSDVRVVAVDSPPSDPLLVGSALEVEARVALGDLVPDDVTVQLYYGPLDAHGDVSQASIATLGAAPAADGDGIYRFSGTIPCAESGQFGYSVRVLPMNVALPNPFEPGLVTWG